MQANRKIITVLIVVRHGETEWNLSGRYQGQLESPLAPRGVSQAKALAKGLSGKGINIIYSSDLGRAVQTSEIIAHELRQDFTLDQGLRERNLGIIQGKTRGEFIEMHPEEANSFKSDNPDYAPPDGESVKIMYLRNISCLESIVSKNLGRKILVVTHGGVLLNLLYKILNIPPARFTPVSLFNASINTFSITDGKWKLESWGELQHLKGLESADGVKLLECDDVI